MCHYSSLVGKLSTLMNTWCRLILCVQEVVTLFI